MKKLNALTAIWGLALLSFVFMIDGCKKEPVATPVTTTTSTTTGVTTKTSTTPVAVGAQTTPMVQDSSNYLKGYLGGTPVKFEGNAVSYNGYVDPDSSTDGENGNSGHPGSRDNDAYFVVGSKWVVLPVPGVAVTNASVEIRSLAVRVFVSPIQAQSSNYYNLLGLLPYQVATDNNPGNGAYVSLYDSRGVLWTTAGDQDGSALIVTSVGPNMNTYAMVTGLISCKMYDGHGHMQKLTDATFTAALGI